jgi:hypothetical protein
MSILAVHRGRGGEVVVGLLALARATGELAEPEVAAVGDQRAHAARLGEGQRLAVVGLAALGVEPVGMSRDVAEQGLSMGRDPGVTRRGFDHAVAQAPRLVEPAEQVVDPSENPDDSPRRPPLEELVAFPEPVQRLTRLAELRQYPSGGADRPGKMKNDISRTGHRDPVKKPSRRRAPFCYGCGQPNR